jgi:large subunit ribosomal protein L30
MKGAGRPTVRSSAVTPATRGASPKPGGRLRIRQVRSGIGFEAHQKATLRALGLEKIGRERVLPDTQQVRGMLAKVPHLVQFEEVGPDSKE